MDLRVVAEQDAGHEVGLLGEPHAVHLAAGPGHLRGHPPAARRVREDPVGAAGVVGRSELLDEVRHLVDRELLRGELVGLAAALGIAEVRRRGLVPHAPRRLLAVVFAFHHRQLLDLASALGADAHRHELGRDLVGAPMGVGAPTVRVVGVHVGAQLARVLAADLLVAALPDEDRGMVAIVDDHVAEGRGAHLPGRSVSVRLAVHARLVGDEPQPVAGGDAGRPARAMPPADEVGARLAHQAQRVGVEPVRLRRAQARPLVGRLLAPAAELQGAAVQEEPRLRVPAGAADAERHLDAVHLGARHPQRRHHAVEVRPIGRPRLRRPQQAGDGEGGAGAGGHLPAIAQGQGGRAVRVVDLDHQLDLLRPRARVLHGNLDAHLRRVLPDLRRVRVRPGRAQEAVEGQRDVQRVRHVEAHVAEDPAVSRVPVRVVPGDLVRLQLLDVLGDVRALGVDHLRQGGAGRWRHVEVGPARRAGRGRWGRRRTRGAVLLRQRVLQEAVVAHHRQHVGGPEAQVRRELQPEGREARLADAQERAVQVHLGHLAHGLELEEDLPAPIGGGEHERLAVPGAPAPLVPLAAMPRQRPVVEGVDVVVGVRGGDGVPGTVVERDRGGAGGVGLGEPPAGVEVQGDALGGGAGGREQGQAGGEDGDRRGHGGGV